MKASFKFLFIMAIGLFGASCSAQAPKGKLIYCSYSSTGMAGLGKDYCELIADKDSTPKVVVALRLDNRFDEPEIRAEYPVGQEVVDSLQAMLADSKVYQLNGYNVDELMSGGHAYRIYQEYDSGEKVNARWYGHDIKPEALAAYDMIERFFAPWREKATKSQEPIVECAYTARRVAGRGTDECRLICPPGYVPQALVRFDLDNRLNRPERHGQIDLTDEQVTEILQALNQLHVQDLEDYDQDDHIEGGTICSVSVKYLSGRQQSFRWHTTDPNRDVLAVYNRLVSFFEPLKAQADEVVTEPE